MLQGIFATIFTTTIQPISKLLLLVALFTMYILSAILILIASYCAALLVVIFFFYLGACPMTLAVKAWRRWFWYPLIIRFETLIETALERITNIEVEIDLSGRTFFKVLFKLTDVFALCGAMIVFWRILIRCSWVVEMVDGCIEDSIIEMLGENGWVVDWLPHPLIEITKCVGEGGELVDCYTESEWEVLVLSVVVVMELGLGLGRFLAQIYRKEVARVMAT